MNEVMIGGGESSQRYWRDLWAYRELFFFLAWRDILVRYKQAVLGILWCILKPVVTMVVFTLVFGKIAGLSSEGVPYPVFVFAALLPWQFFSSALTESSNSLITNGSLLSKVYFPRLMVPLSSMMVNLVDFVISFAVLLCLMFWYGCWPTWHFLLLPLILLPAFFASLGCGLWFASLNVKYRDFKYLVPFIAQFGLFISPVGFASSVVPEQWQVLYSLNPMVGVIDAFRWAVSGGSYQLSTSALWLSCGTAAAALATGLWYFRCTERGFADMI